MTTSNVSKPGAAPGFTLVFGGARSGKSRFAQQRAEARWRHPLYLATAEVQDDEMAERVRRHRDGRGARWTCIEEPVEIVGALERVPDACDGILLDCATIWLSNILLREGRQAVAGRTSDLLAALCAAPREILVVSNEVGLGIVPDTPLGREFRDLQGWLNQDLAAAAGTVVLIAAGLPLCLKGSL